MRQPKPWYRKSTTSWYVQIGRKQVRLGRDKQAVWTKYHEFMSVTRGAEPEDETTIVSLYRAWCEKNHAPSTCKKNYRHLEGAIRSVSNGLLVAALKPHHIQHWVDGRYQAYQTYSGIRCSRLR